ncbi:Ku protein [Neorhizobium sp. DAR64872/K0K18]|uniref:non-homologous end joining protein Ku n=1 Tax=Neorhizobium sp. DAR64872/K0K18 TaxID=3421958 RepID=UPI003D2B1210
MAIRPYWKGYLKLSLVTCSVEMTPATSESEKVRFHTLNRETGNRVQSHYVDSVTGKPVRDDDEVKGYQRGEDDYVMLEDEELDNVALESTKTIDISTFTPRSDIDWIWLDTPYYLTPNEKVSEEAFSVIRAAMDSQEMVGISRLVLGRRERAVMIEPRGKGIVLWTLRFGDEVREAKDYFDGLDKAEPEKETLPLIRKLIEQQTRPWDAKFVTDPVQDNLLDIIKSKKKQRRPTPKMAEKEESDKPSNVIDIMDALKRSLAADKRKSK